MPKGPRGEKRPGDVIGAAIMVAKIATGEVEDQLPDPAKRSAGVAGGKGRFDALSSEQRSNIAKVSAKKRWSPHD